MDSEELMIENPVSVAILLELLPCNSPGHLPISNESLQQFILEDVMLIINLQFRVISRHVPCDIVCRLHLYWFSRSNLSKLTRLSSRDPFGSSEGDFAHAVSLPIIAGEDLPLRPYRLSLESGGG